MNADVEMELDFEPEDELGSVGALKAKMQKLRDELERVKMERQEYLDGWQRCKADSVNAKKEASLEGQRAGNRIKESFVEDMIPALDSFDLATGSPGWASVGAEWRNGMEGVQNQILDALTRHGVQRFAKVGDMYDPHLHDIVQEVEESEGPSGQIIRVLRYGYAIGERILRPAHVVIKK